MRSVVTGREDLIAQLLKQLLLAILAGAFDGVDGDHDVYRQLVIAKAAGGADGRRWRKLAFGPAAKDRACDRRQEVLAPVSIGVRAEE
jgi:hypothetical protein